MSPFAGTGRLLRLALRLDRIRLVVWILAIAGVTVSTAAAFAQLYPTVASRQPFAAGIGRNPALIALIGPAFDLTSIGGLTAWRVGGIGAILTALMGSFTVVRHSRTEEEAGRLELVGAAAVGRRAPLTAALCTAFGASAAIAAVVTLGLAGSAGLPVSGALALGLSFAAAGCMFAAIAAVAAQVTENARAASGITSGILGLSFLLRAIGDGAGEGGPAWLSWLSPVGWAQRVRPFAGERWWVLGMAAALTAVTLVAAYALVARRDLGAGLLPPRLGPAEGAPGLRSPLALAWRLHRGSLLAWTVGLTAFGLVLGSIAEGLTDLFDDNPQLAEMFARMGGERQIIDTFFSSILGLVGLLAAAYAIQAALRMRSEENQLRAEPVLATSIGRLPWTASHLVFAVVGAALPLLGAGLGAGVAHGLRAGDVGGQVVRLLGAALVQLPAVWILAGLTVALFGLKPRFTIAAWGALVVFLLLGQLGPMLQLDQALMDVSPFTHVPRLPGGTFSVLPLVLLAAVAGVLAAVGLAGFRRRDLG
jgi:ABC-2 type transport system permease protein